MPKDALRLRNMRFFAYHGLFPEETALGQHYEVDVELYGDFRQAGRSATTLTRRSTIQRCTRWWPMS